MNEMENGKSFLCKIWRRFWKKQSESTKISGCDRFGCFLAIFCKKWLNSESGVLKVVCRWFKVHSMRNIRLLFKNNNKIFKISKSGWFWLFFAKNGWILNLGYQKRYARGLKFIRCGIYDFHSEITIKYSKYQNLTVFG